MKLSIAFAALLVVLFGVVQGTFDLDGNIENVGQREVTSTPLDLRGIAYSQSIADDCTESTTLIRTTSSNKDTATVVSITEIYTYTSPPVLSSSVQAATTLMTSWGSSIHSLQSSTFTSHRPASSSPSKVSINTYPISSRTRSAHNAASSSSSTESCSEVSTLTTSSTTQMSYASSTSHGVSSSNYTSSQSKTFGPSSTESCIETFATTSLSSSTRRSDTTHNSRKHSTSRSSSEHTTKPSNRTSSTSTTQAAVIFTPSTSYQKLSTVVILSTQSVPISSSSTGNCTESSTYTPTLSTPQGIATSSSFVISHDIATYTISTESCDKTSTPALPTSHSLPSTSSYTSSAVTISSTVTVIPQSLPTVLSGATYSYSTTSVRSSVTSTAQGIDSTSTECSEISNSPSAEYQLIKPSSTSANAGEFTVPNFQSSSIALVNVSSIPRSSFTKPNVLPSKGRFPLADEPDVVSITTENIPSTSTALSSSTVFVFTTITVLPSPQTVAALATPNPTEMASHAVTVGTTSIFTSMSTVVELTTIIVPPQSSFAFTEIQPQNPPTTASQVPSLTSPPPTIFTAGPGPLCNGDNCLNELNRFNASAIPFCLTYTTTINTDTAAIPTYLENCNLSAQAVSSACSCMMSSSSQSPTAFLPSPSTTSKVLKNASPTLTETIIVSTPAGIVALNEASSSPKGIPPVTLPGAAASPLGGFPTLSSYTATFSTYNTDTTLQTFLTPSTKPPVSYNTPESANTVSLSATAVGPPLVNTSGLNGNLQPTPVFPWMGSGQNPPPVGTGAPLVISPVGNITTSGSQGVHMGRIKLLAVCGGFFTFAMVS